MVGRFRTPYSIKALWVQIIFLSMYFILATMGMNRDGRIPLFFDIRIFGYLGYQFFLDTWIIGYLDIMDTWIHGYMDTWISVFFGYMDTWILWMSIFFIIHILDILSKYPDIFGYFFKLPNMKKRQSIQVLRLCSMFILSIDKIRSMNK